MFLLLLLRNILLKQQKTSLIISEHSAKTTFKTFNPFCFHTSSVIFVIGVLICSQFFNATFKSDGFTVVVEDLWRTHRAKKGRHHGEDPDGDWQDESGSLKTKDHSDQRGVLQAFLLHLFLPESLQSAETNRGSDPTNVFKTRCWKKEFQLCRHKYWPIYLLIEMEKGAKRPRPVSAGVSSIKMRQAKAGHVQPVFEYGPHHRGHPGKSCKGQEAGIVHRVGSRHEEWPFNTHVHECSSLSIYVHSCLNWLWRRPAEGLKSMQAVLVFPEQRGVVDHVFVVSNDLFWTGDFRSSSPSKAVGCMSCLQDEKTKGTFSSS